MKILKRLIGILLMIVFAVVVAITFIPGIVILGISGYWDFIDGISDNLGILNLVE